MASVQKPRIDISSTVIPPDGMTCLRVCVSGSATIEMIGSCKDAFLGLMELGDDVSVEIRTETVDFSFLQLIASTRKSLELQGRQVHLHGTAVFAAALENAGFRMTCLPLEGAAEANDSGGAGGQHDDDAVAPLSRESLQNRLAALPEAMVSALATAAATLKPQKVSEAIDAIAQHDSLLAWELTSRAEKFHYYAILDAIEIKT